MMNISKLKWIKNVKHQDNHQYWAYLPETMQIVEAKIFCLNWRDIKQKSNAQKPSKGDLMILLQRAKVTHIVEFLDDEVYDNSLDEWSIYRVVKAVWMPSKGIMWDDDRLHQKEFFGLDYIVGDGHAHSLADNNKMPQFHEYWNQYGGLSGFKNHVLEKITKI